jgi:hypothetical protein
MMLDKGHNEQSRTAIKAFNFGIFLLLLKAADKKCS